LERPFTIPQHPIRFAPMVGYSYGVKSQPNQIRAELNILHTSWPSTEIGGSLGLGIRKQTLVSLGPTFVHWLSWPRLGPFRKAIYGGLPFFYISQNSKNDVLFGVKFGGELSWVISHTEGSTIDFLLRVGTEALLFGSETVSIPLIGMTGIALHF